MHVTEQQPLPGLEALTVEPVLKVSADARRTLRQHALVARGFHPLALSPTRPELGTCGGCAWRVLFGAYPKCTLPGDRARRLTHGPATDCRAWWPACGDFEGKSDG